ncbi:MAG: hypothetical protein IAF02_18650 [Anaerolineae bacterium]|nr:hypothetical protein [Anaerolineae bacterium]
MTLQTNDSSPKVILQRIDTIISELQVLRQQVLTIQPIDPPSTNLVEELAGVLGQGTWDEYDPDLDWKRFDE